PPIAPLPATSPSALSTLSLHDALPICLEHRRRWRWPPAASPSQPSTSSSVRGFEDSPPSVWPRRVISTWKPRRNEQSSKEIASTDRKSTRLNSSHVSISYAVFCLKQKP